MLLNRFPVILTKNRDWATRFGRHTIVPGLIIVLPEDAILIEVPDVTSNANSTDESTSKTPLNSSGQSTSVEADAGPPSPSGQIHEGNDGKPEETSGEIEGGHGKYRI